MGGTPGGAHGAAVTGNLGGSPSAPRTDSTNAWTPLGVPLFRALWIAGLASNIGGMMQLAGAAWLMTDLSPSPVLVSLMQAAGSLPVFLLAIPAGALADVVDQRRLILAAQWFTLLVAALLAILSYLGLVTPWLLLGLVFMTAAGSALATPALQAVLGAFLPHAEVSKGIVLQNVSLNLARAVGPLVAGLLIARSGPWVVFVLNAVSFFGLLAVFYRWQEPTRDEPLPAERFFGAIMAGMRYLRYSPPLRAALARGAVFALGGSALWALLPLAARGPLGLGPVGFGLLMGCMGVGALLAAIFLPRLRRLIHTDLLVAGMTLVFAIATLALGHVRFLPLLGVLLVAGGIGWLACFSSLIVAAGGAVPKWVKGRGLAVYSLAFQGAMTAGSLLWGAIATKWGVPTALTAAAVALAVGSLSALVWRLDWGETLDVTPTGTRPAPEVAVEPEPERGPVMVTVEYRIDPPQGPAFSAAMREIGQERYRNGAFFWGLFEDVADPGRYVEFFTIESWLEHLRQHERVTVSERDVEEGAKAFHIGSEPPRVSHFVAEPAVTRSRPVHGGIHGDMGAIP